MMTSLVAKIGVVIHRLELTVGSILGKRLPPDDFYFALAGFETQKCLNKTPSFSLKDIVGDGLLWAVPKHRRSAEKRLKRKFGHPDYIWKLLTPKKNLYVCNTCGDNHEPGVLCPTCYQRVKEETKQMQDAIQNELKLEPVTKEVVVLYNNEKEGGNPEMWEGKRIVEMKKERPSWFSKNLLQQTTQPLDSTKDVKPSGLS